MVYFLEGVGRAPDDSVKRLLTRGILREEADAMFGVPMSLSLRER